MFDYDLKQIQRKYLMRAKLAALILELTPFIRMVGLNGSLARGEANEESDIDFIIIVKEDRIWTCRAFSLVLMAIFGLKRYPNKIKGRICLNLYQTEDHLELSCKTKDLPRFHSYTLALFNQNMTYECFRRENNWIRQFGKNFVFDSVKPSSLGQIFFIILYPIRWFFELVFDLIFNDWGENTLKKYQTKRIMNDPRTSQAPLGAIFLSDTELRFHPPKSVKKS